MRAFFRFQWLCAKEAWRGSISIANAWYGLWGPVLLWLVARWWGRPIMLPDRIDGYAVLFTLACLGSTWISLFFVRFIGAPSRLYWAERKKTQTNTNFTVAESLLAESKYVLKEDNTETDYYQTTFYLPVSNMLVDAKTLRRVQARIFVLGEPELCEVKETGGTEIDLRHGETAYFSIGRVISTHAMGLIEGSVVFTAKEIASFDLNVPNRHIKFSTKKHKLANARDGADHTWRLLTIISADESHAKQVVLEATVSSLKSRVSIVGSAM